MLAKDSDLSGWVEVRREQASQEREEEKLTGTGVVEGVSDLFVDDGSLGIEREDLLSQ